MSDARVPFDRLLVHREWLRSVARALASTDAAADDLEQDTWLEARRSPPHGERNGRGWLRTVIGNRARKRARAAGRRRSHEHAVAARTGVPVATARTRVRRGAERMRTVLGGEAGGWLGAVTPVLGASGSPAAAVHATTAGVVAMQVKTKAVVLATLAAALIGGVCGVALLVATADGARVRAHDEAACEGPRDFRRGRMRTASAVGTNAEAKERERHEWYVWRGDAATYVLDVTYGAALVENEALLATGVEFVENVREVRDKRVRWPE